MPAFPDLVGIRHFLATKIYFYTFPLSIQINSIYLCIENINTMKNNYTAMEPKYLDVNKKIGHNIVDLVQASGDGKVYVDDVLIAVWEAIVGIDVKSLTPEQWRKNIFCQCVLF